MNGLKNKRTVVISIAVGIMALIGAVVFLQGSSGRELKKQLDLGHKFLTELNYESAIVEFEKAIAIDGKCVEAYMGIADAYEALGEATTSEEAISFYQKGLDILSKGYEVTQDESLGERIKQFEEMLEAAQLRYAEETACKHVWQEATCEKRKTCLLCGEGEGSRKDHNLTEANFQQPRICVDCGATVGDPLKPLFEQTGFWADDMYGYFDYDRKYGIYDYKCFVSDENHPEKEGYVYQTCFLSVPLDFTVGTEDYYDPKLADDTKKENDGKCYSIHFYDKIIDDCYRNVEWYEYYDEDGEYYCDAFYTFLVPEGYDGNVVGMMPLSYEWNGDYIYDLYSKYAGKDMCHFRLPAAYPSDY